MNIDWGASVWRRKRCDRGYRWPGRMVCVCAISVLFIVGHVGCRNDADRDSNVRGKAESGRILQAETNHRDAVVVESSSDRVWFEDVTDRCGIDFVHKRGPLRFWLPEITGGGGGWIDYDADGDCDLYVVQGGDLTKPDDLASVNALFENLGDGTFRDVTDTAGVGDTGYGMGVAVGDYDADGHLDLYVTNVGRNVLYRNLGDGSFADVTQNANASGSDVWSTSAAFVDYDQDGDLDLLIANYLNWSPESERECLDGSKQRDYCAPNTYQSPTADTLLRNEGDGTFVDVSREAGLHSSVGNGLGIALGDFDYDGRVDFYIANDGNPNHLWLQKEPGRFHDHALVAGCAVNRLGAPEAGMGVAAVDIENDGDLDLFMTHLVDETNTLYLNHGGFFEDVTATRGLAHASLRFTGFGIGFVDFDHDGHLDLFVANGRVTHAHRPIVERDRFAEPNQVFRGTGDGRFVEIVGSGTTTRPLIETSRGAAFADFDLDGAVDVAVVNSGGRLRLLANQIGRLRPALRFRVLDGNGHDAIGARLRLVTDAGVQYRWVQRVYSYLASNEAIVHFGLPEGKNAIRVEVSWPNGTQRSFDAPRGTGIQTLRPN